MRFAESLRKTDHTGSKSLVMDGQTRWTCCHEMRACTGWHHTVQRSFAPSHSIVECPRGRDAMKETLLWINRNLVEQVGDEPPSRTSLGQRLVHRRREQSEDFNQRNVRKSRYCSKYKECNGTWYQTHRVAHTDALKPDCTNSNSAHADRAAAREQQIQPLKERVQQWTLEQIVNVPAERHADRSPRSRTWRNS